MNEYNELMNAQLEGVEIELHQTPAGYLLRWGDYVANSWVMGFETLAEAFEMLAKIAKDTHN